MTLFKRQPTALELHHRAIREWHRNPTISTYVMVDGREVRRRAVDPLTRLGSLLDRVMDTIADVCGIPAPRLDTVPGAPWLIADEGGAR
ncbi:hypothetical protein SEA_BRUSACORAM_66 [Mycobacterium phage Brusacoram]|uniref:Uncharacterized protein n=4 Tax=Fishburnevirus TaxID=1983734 RepID=A0A0K1Y690_9CAUD|nr:hypothetical protein SEA_BRUSACORAM_66 [Mycobacterium phage Brusacoram]YP_009964399.1 hypothetical protein I5J40_gp66 [Mycobacterium phage Atcoo]ASR84921.1 hypothetical protein SEA_STEVIERAY_69 [Mycobacterium phage StevieRay]ATW59195.1 hypothetical protein SEA_THESPIS_66 [Mycobacterium phage Thespis]WDW19833.1 hypothetical protein [Mycobacterium phage LOCV3]AKY02592.1 hypothetical protein SEA_BRUSACORAM_66 [Mycobacterium phage Brusacoram]QGJ88644.1 hypothetical protein SEA_ATCOO_66 [Mycoba